MAHLSEKRKLEADGAEPLEPPIVDTGALDEWFLRFEGFNPSQEGVRETLCTLGNGYVATRGAAPESVADGVHYPGTYVAGLYNRRHTVIGGRSVENESIVNLPNWLPLNFRVESGRWFRFDEATILECRQQLDLRAGVLHRLLRVRDDKGRTTRIEQRRFVSMADRHIAALETSFVPEDWSGRLTIRSGLDGRVENAGVDRYRHFNDDHLVGHQTGAVAEETIFLQCQTNQSDVRLAEAARTRIFRAGVLERPARRLLRRRDSVAQEMSLEVMQGETVTAEKVVTIYTSRDRPSGQPLSEAWSWIGRIAGFDDLLSAHVRTWQHLWKRFSLDVEDGGGLTSLALHLHIFHLLQTVSRHSVDLDAGVPARGLHGEAYRGHVFWDELFIFPNLNFHIPQIVQSLLLYRWRRLPEARWAARQAGFRGAMFPWQSGSDGREEAQVLHLNPVSGHWLPDSSHLQRHINSAIAYNVWRHYEITHDIDFLAGFGAPMIFEIARFWASTARYNETDDRYDILGVMGPDEYHDGYPGADRPGLDNNAYTNVMAAWVLCRALALVDLLPEPRRSELRDQLELDEDELALWDDVSRKLRVVFHHDGVISQFEGYEDLEELDWAGYRARYGDIARLDRLLESEGDSPNRYKASKQADVLMLFYLFSADELRAIMDRLGYPFPPELIPRTIDYYLQRTSHGSTLSYVVHSWVLARSDRERSWSLFEDALRSDLADAQQGTTAEGIHLGAMAGTLDILQRCYLGIEVRDGTLWFNPLLPPEVRSLGLELYHKRRWMKIRVTQKELVVQVQDWGEGTVRVGMGGVVEELEPGACRRVTL